MKNTLPMFYFLSLLLWTKDIASGNSFHKLIVWNTGYSQYQTLINDHICLHIDPGGTLLLPLRAINTLCQNKLNRYTFLQNDKFHTSYINQLIQVFQNTKEINEPRSLITNSTSKNHLLISFAHLNRTQLEQILFQEINLFKKYKSIILPNHGQPKHLTKYKILMLSKFHMLITGSQSKKYENHQSTKAKFTKIQKNLILKNKWGHLIFETIK